jgi:death on curing protein
VIRYLLLDDLLRIAERATGARVEVRDAGLLESALARPRTTVFGEDAYPTLHLQAAALLHSLVRNYALVDGNKRLGFAATAVFLGINGHRVVTGDDDVVEFVLAVADGSCDDLATIAGTLAGWTPPAAVTEEAG